MVPCSGYTQKPGLIVFVHESAASSQLSVVQAKPSLQFGWVRVQVPSVAHMSLIVQKRPSSQGPPAALHAVGRPTLVHT